jgi:hypothetical protein
MLDTIALAIGRTEVGGGTAKAPLRAADTT